MVFYQPEIYQTYFESDDGTFVPSLDPIKICDLPSFARVHLNIILLPFDSLRLGKKHGARKGSILGSLSYSVFEINHIMKSGYRTVNLWPFTLSNKLMVC